MKIYNKAKLHVVDGFITTKKGKIVGVNKTIVEQANRLETELQKCAYAKSQSETTPDTSFEGFERVSSQPKYEVSVATPKLDEAIKETMHLMNEIDTVNNVAKINQMIEEYADLVEFADKDIIIATDAEPVRFDTHFLGSPLNYSRKLIVKAIACICGMEPDKFRITYDECDE